MSAVTTPELYVPGAVDADVHVAPASFAELRPHLSSYWQQYLDESSIRPPLVTHAYPPLAASSLSEAARARGAAAPPCCYEDLAHQYLDVANPAAAVLTCVTGYDSYRNPFFTAAMATALNDWVVAEFLGRDPRLRASLVVSTVSPQDAVAEIERVGGRPEFVAVLLPIRSDQPWGHRNQQPIFAAAREHGLQVTLHAWGRPGKAPTPSGFTGTYLEDYVANQPIAQAQLLSLVCDGVFEQFPDLRVVVAEAGFAWLPPLLWRFDKDWKGVWREVPWVTRLPSEYVRDHVRLTTAPAHLPPDDDQLDELLGMMGGPGMLMFASDFPHQHDAGIGRLLARLGDEDRAAVLGGTATETYGLSAAAPR